MQLKAKKFTVVFCMWLALASQAYTMAFASNIHAHPALLSSPTTTISDHEVMMHHEMSNTECDNTNSLVCMDTANDDNPCCDQNSDCSSVHCSSLSACSSSEIKSDMKIRPEHFSMNNPQLLNNRVTSLYRPPIAR